MAKNGFRVMDSDLHTIEPDGLWERYLEEPFKRFAPRFTRRAENAPNQPIIEIGDLAIAEMSKRPHTAVVGKDLQRRAFARHPHYEIAHARGYDSQSHVQAMDIEGIDVAIIYGTRGRQVLMHDDLAPEVAAALAPEPVLLPSSRPTPTRRCSGRWWKRSVTTASSSRPTIHTRTVSSRTPSRSSCTSRA